MPTLKEIKGRIASVKSTLKITSAMKLVSSAKLRKAQSAIEAMRPYEEHLQAMLSLVSGGPGAVGPAYDSGVSAEKGSLADGETPAGAGVRVIVAMASNSSLCGGFNASVIAKVREVRRPGDVVYAIGRKMADAMRKDGFPSPKDFTALAEHPAYAPVAALYEHLAEEVAAGRVSRVLLVYNHFASTARQVPVVEPLLPVLADRNARPGAKEKADASLPAALPAGEAEDRAADVILEPGRKELMAALLPKTLKIKLYAALLDSAASEHAARTIAMQTATDNGENLLSELTLQYNKGRQQKITAEILDLAGGQATK